MNSERTSRYIGMLLVALVALGTLTGCATEGPPDVMGNPGPPVEPASADLSGPESAVMGYLDWVSYSYRTGDSGASAHVMTSWEGVRVDSYIEFNRQQSRAIEQDLLLFEVRSLESDVATATLAAREEWEYRYFSIETGEYISEPLAASYDSTYTVVLVNDQWLVDSVEVDPLAPVQ